MKIRFCGATSGVTGSCHLLMTDKHQVLLDCGQFQGGKAQEAMNAEPFPFDPEEIECVILSHAHIDHCGRLPLLVKRGFHGTIYCTSATADLLGVMLQDSAYIHEREAEWQNRKNIRAGKPEVEPLYTAQDAVNTMQYVHPVLYQQLVEINDEMRIVFNDAGHILGSAITEIWVKEDNCETKVVFTGDLGERDRPILRDPTIIKKADCVIMETTYGDRLHTEHVADIQKLINIILNTTRRGGTAVIPSFAVGRTQELIYQLNQFYEHDERYKEELSRLTVYVDSPMATTATEVFRRNPQVFDEETRQLILSGDDPLDFPNLRFTKTSDESKQLNFDHSPKVIISASGMCDAGRIRHHLKHNLWDPKSSVIFVGYQAVGTLGRALVDGAKDVTLFGEQVHVNAEIHNLQGFSAHADQHGLFSWAAGLQSPPKQLFLVHGELSAKETFARLLHDQLGFTPIVLNGNAEFEISGTDVALLNREEAEKHEAENVEIQRLRDQISAIHGELENILYNANLAMRSGIPEKRLVQMNNIVQELDKSVMDLGAAVSEAGEEEKMIPKKV